MIVWARQGDPITRHWIRSKDSETFVAIPRTRDFCPILVLVARGGESFLQKGPAIRAIVESGIACAYIAVDKQSIDQLGRQLTDVVSDNHLANDLKKQGLVMVGEGTRASTMLIAALKAPGVHPDLFVSVPEETEINPVLDRLIKAEENLRCPILIANKSKSVEATDATKTLSSQREIEIFAFDASDDARPRDLFFYKQLTERVREKLLQLGKSPNLPLERQNNRSRWGCLGLPAALLTLFAIMFVINKTRSSSSARARFRAARGVAIVIGTTAGIGTAVFVTRLPLTVHTPDAKRSTQLSGLAKRWQLSPTETAKFAEYSSLSDYTRKLVNWKLDERIYTEDVLNPRIVADLPPDFDWRQPLWKYFYPLIRRAATPRDAANILVNYLRLEVEAPEPGARRENNISAPSMNIEEIWNKRTTTSTGFEQIYVAALRAVGIAARLNPQARVEIWDDGEWKAAPRPAELVRL